MMDLTQFGRLWVKPNDGPLSVEEYRARVVYSHGGSLKVSSEPLPGYTELRSDDEKPN